MITLIKTLFSAAFTGALGLVSPGLAFALKEWKLIALVLALGGVGFEGWHLARSWDREATLVAQAETMKHRLSTITLLQASDAKRAKDNSAALTKLKETASDTPKDVTACLPRAAVGRVRAVR